jgi:hypothetical protein
MVRRDQTFKKNSWGVQGRLRLAAMDAVREALEVVAQGAHRRVVLAQLPLTPGREIEGVVGERSSLALPILFDGLRALAPLAKDVAPQEVDFGGSLAVPVEAQKAAHLDEGRVQLVAGQFGLYDGEVDLLSQRSVRVTRAVAVEGLERSRQISQPALSEAPELVERQIGMAIVLVGNLLQHCRSGAVVAV